MVDITDEDWKLYQEKFGDLISFIAQRITGDPMCCDYEENVQDLNVAAINSINGYYKKNKLTVEDVPVKDVIKNRLFASYSKTCLWNYKNHKGVRMTRYKNTFVDNYDTESYHE